MGGGAKQQGSDIHGGASLVRRDKLSVGGNGEVDGFDEKRLWDWWDGDVAGGMLHAQGVLVRAKDGDVSIRLTEGFHSFVALDSIVETRGHAMDGEMWGAEEFGFAPGWVVARGISESGLDVSIDFSDLEADIGPVCKVKEKMSNQSRASACG